MEGTPEGKEMRLMEEGFILQMPETVRRQSTDAATNAVDTAMPRTGQIPHGPEAGLKQVILLTGKTVQALPTAEPEVLKDHRQPGETGAKGPPVLQGKGHPASKEALRAIPELLLQVATDLSPLLPRIAEAPPEALLEPLPQVATDPSALLLEAQVGLLLLLPQVAEVFPEVLLEPLPWAATDPSALLPEA